MATEHHIQVAFRHFLDPGDVVFDVGANKGWLSAPLARIVGAKGKVVCFEPSRRNLDELRAVAAQFPQVQIVEKGVFSKGGETIRFFENPFSNADSIYFEGEGATVTEIETVTLDDFVKAAGVTPTLIKMDIEGAEYDALLGARELISRAKPIIVLELRETDLRPLELLREHGYTAINLRTLGRLSDDESVFSGATLEDVLFLPPQLTRRSGPLFVQPPGPQQFVFSRDDGAIVFSAPVSVGVNVLQLGFDAVHPHAEYDVHVLQNGRCIVYQRGAGAIVLEPFLSIVAPCTAPGVVDIVVSGANTALELKSVQVRLAGFGEALPKHVGLQSRDPFGIDCDVLLPDLEDAANRGQQQRFETYLRHMKASTRESGRVCYWRGMLDLRADRVSEALAHFHNARQLGYDLHWSEYMTAVALERVGDPIGARRAAQAALDASPNSTYAKDLLERLGA